MKHENRRALTLRFLAQPTDVNFGGKVHGGTMMKWIDEVGYACARRWCGTYCVTAHIGDVSFYNSVQIGSLVELHAKVIYTGNSSMHIAIRVESSNLDQQQPTKAIHCILIFVSVDVKGKPLKVKSWEPSSEEDKSLQQYAVNLMALRKELNKKAGQLNYGKCLE